jgi:hypothetical protein
MELQKYLVRVVRPVFQTTYVEVEARDERDAEGKACVFFTKTLTNCGGDATIRTRLALTHGRWRHGSPYLFKERRESAGAPNTSAY